ncbi:TetR family transcriptional regulator [Litchfieldella qijiaojingensis]|uniref:TetR family transcriptional regulator n=1 Tax=Litchfieldella qijiaojingensis TaxID=980347 RepID=A0ABQ2ZBL0_9GAMM|nr:TetR/AcrR family transcriptional regulator [Halomonas qijiaojingensis]GGY09844.1 TetR family transcriptional regulator [Halomonas qijiaojingensis]
MPWSETHKSRTRERILHSAVTLFIRHGFDGISIDAVMEHAGLTRGAFYAHFSSKSELYTKAIHFAARQGAAELATAENAAIRIERYLSEEHLRGGSIQCPLACLVSDVAQQDERVRATYTRLFEGFIDYFSSTSDPDDPARRQVLQQTVTMIGGLAIARTLTDDELANELLDACRELAHSLAQEGEEAAMK